MAHTLLFGLLGLFRLPRRLFGQCRLCIPKVRHRYALQAFLRRCELFVGEFKVTHKVADMFCLAEPCQQMTAISATQRYMFPFSCLVHKG